MNTDVNECAENIDNCEHTCENTVGSFLCGCNAGYELTSDGRTCQGMNMCSYRWVCSIIIVKSILTAVLFKQKLYHKHYSLFTAHIPYIIVIILYRYTQFWQIK